MEQPTNSEEKSTEFRLKCSVHSEEICCTFCKTCQTCVCQKCVTLTHNKHDFSEIKDFNESKLNVIRRQHKTILEKTKCLFEKEQELKAMRSAEQLKHDKIKKDILDYKQALINDNQKQTEKLLQKLEQKWHSTLNDVGENKKKVKQELEQLQGVKNKIERVIQPSHANDMFAVSRSFMERIKTKMEVNSVFREVPNFINGNIAKISSSYGYLEDFPVMLKTDLQVEKKLNTLTCTITKLAVCSDRSLWQYAASSETLQRVEPDGMTLNILSSFNINVLDMVLLPSGDLLLSIHGLSNLKIVSQDTPKIMKDSIYTVAPFNSGPLHVTFDNKLIIGVNDIESITRSEHQLVIIMDEKGNKERVFQYDTYNEPLFTSTRFISSNKLKNMAIIDMVFAEHGRIVVINMDGSVRNIYRGHSTVKQKHDEFRPSGITSTQLNNFVVSDSDSHSLHILNSEGEILTLCDTKDIGVLSPFSLCFSEERLLYIGCANNGKNDPAKICIIKNFIL